VHAGAADSNDFRAVMAAFPTGVTVVTAIGDAGPSGATANAVTSLSLDPPMMLACLDRSSRTLASVRAAGRFGINVLAADQEPLARRFASKQPEAEKWEGVDWEGGGSPRIARCPIWIACDLRELLEGGDHLIAIGDVREAELVEAEPLLYHGGGYRGLG
jgi:3-hydroxy-9,10-secoandrosta-1,3,5(10)-triene-9,17-dione monooxygenase reductase component